MPSLAALRDELHAKQTQLHEIFAKYDDVLSMSPDDAKEVKGRNDEMTELSKKVEESERMEKIRDSNSDSLKSRQTPVTRAPLDRGEGQAPMPAVKSLRQVMAESAEYKAFREGTLKTVNFSLPDGVKTLMTLTTINNPATRMPGIRESLQDESTVADLMLDGTTDANTLTYMEETTFTNAAATVAEGAAKPEGALGFTERTENIRKIATWLPATKELLEDVAGIESYIRGRLSFMVRRTEESQLLNGNGTAPNILGILNRSGIQTQARGTDPVPDAIYKAMTKVRVTGLAEPTAYVTHPNDWQDVRLLRTADGIYLWGAPSDAGPDRIWGLTVRQTPLIAENTGLVGAFRPFAQVFRRTGIDVQISTEHSTFFTENKIAILAEERLGLAVYRNSAFCSVTSV